VRLAWPQLAGAGVVVAVGAAGLVFAAVPDSPAAAPRSTGQVTVSDAYMRTTLKGATEGVAYFTVDNTTDRPDRIVGVDTGAGLQAMLHGPNMQPLAHPPAVPAHGKLVLHTGGMHVMVEKLLGPLTAGQTVNIEVDFARAGAIDVVAKVIPYGAPAPGSGGN
jgi:copper(I)-binding protein